jgi:hypothetical protein
MHNLQILDGLQEAEEKSRSWAIVMMRAFLMLTKVACHFRENLLCWTWLNMAQEHRFLTSY